MKATLESLAIQRMAEILAKLAGIGSSTDTVFEHLKAKRGVDANRARTIVLEHASAKGASGHQVAQTAGLTKMNMDSDRESS